MGDLITPDTPGLLAVAFLIGIVVGLTGMGGGALMTPALIFIGGGGARDDTALTAAPCLVVGGPHRGLA